MSPEPVRTGAWIRRFHEADEDAVALVCLPHAGGSASFYFPLSRALAPKVRVFAVQYPGRQDRHREPHPGDLAALVDGVATALAETVTGPLAFFGHSMGAVIGYEVARRVDGPAPVRLFASGRRAPSRHRDESVHTRDDAGIATELRRLAGTHAEVLANEEMLGMILPALRADYRAIETYRHAPGPGLDCPVTVLTGDSDPLVDRAEAQDWQRHTSGPVDVHVFPGGHFFLIDNLTQAIKLVAGSLGVPA